MKMILNLCLWATLLAGAAWATPEAMSEQEKRSYAVGANIGRNLQQQGADFDPEFIAKGLVETMRGKSRLTETEVVTIIRKLREETQQRQEAEFQKKAEENRRRGATFLSEYAKKEGVSALPGGVLYRVLQTGTGDKLTSAEFVFCHFRGTLIDGTEFDTSVPGKPMTFTLDKIIAGMREALLEMPVGSKWEVVIPAEKAYGAKGKGPAIGPNETLIFELELVGGE